MFENERIFVYDEMGEETIQIRYYPDDELLKIGRHALNKEDSAKLRDFINRWLDPQ